MGDVLGGGPFAVTPKVQLGNDRAWFCPRPNTSSVGAVTQGVPDSRVTLGRWDGRPQRGLLGGLLELGRKGVWGLSWDLLRRKDRGPLCRRLSTGGLGDVRAGGLGLVV